MTWFNSSIQIAFNISLPIDFDTAVTLNALCTYTNCRSLLLFLASFCLYWDFKSVIKLFLHKPNYDVISSVYITPWLIIRPDVSLGDYMYHTSFINQFVHYLLLSYLQMISFLNSSLRWCFNRLFISHLYFFVYMTVNYHTFVTHLIVTQKNAQTRSHHIYTK